MQVSTPLGKVGILPRGDYSPTATYNRNDLVTTEVGAYCCMSLEPITGIPTTNTDAWLQITRNGTLGKSAYEYAVDGGYTGTEQQFLTELGQIGSPPSGKNMLLNWDLRYLINQDARNSVQTYSTTETTSELADVWRLRGTGNTDAYRAKATIHPGQGVFLERQDIALPAYFEQLLRGDRSDYKGFPMTLSFELDSMTLNSAADPFRIGFMSGAPGTELLHEDAYLDIASATSGIYTVTWTNDFTDADARFLRVFIYAGRNSSCRIRRAKLEAGTRSTLHLDVVPMSSAEELPRIQRYVYNAFYKTNVNGVAGIGVATNSTTIDIRIPFPVAMYTPNYSLGYATYAIELFSPYYNHVKAPTAITQAYGSHTTTCCVLRITSSGLASGQLYWLRAKETSAGETGAWLNFTCIT